MKEKRSCLKTGCSLINLSDSNLWKSEKQEKGKSERTSVIHFDFCHPTADKNLWCYSKLNRWHRSSLWINKSLTLNPFLKKKLCLPPLPPRCPSKLLNQLSRCLSLHIGCKLENHNLVVADVCVENKPKGHIYVSDVEHFFHSCIFLIAALWGEKKKIDNCSRECFFGCSLACIFIFICTRQCFLQ